jgi:hypothetical protein
MVAVVAHTRAHWYCALAARTSTHTHTHTHSLTHSHTHTHTRTTVSYDGVFVGVTRDSETALFAVLPRDVGLVWRDPTNLAVFGIVSHHVVEGEEVSVQVHMFKVAGNAPPNEALPELVEKLSMAAIGRYPGALGVFAAQYEGSVSVDTASGTEVVNAAMKRIRELDIPERSVEIVIYETRISVIDRDTGNELKVRCCAVAAAAFLSHLCAR